MKKRTRNVGITITRLQLHKKGEGDSFTIVCAEKGGIKFYDFYQDSRRGDGMSTSSLTTTAAASIYEMWHDYTRDLVEVSSLPLEPDIVAHQNQLKAMFEKAVEAKKNKATIDYYNSPWRVS